MFALLGMRALFVLVESLIARFRYLDETIAIVLGLVGVKLLIEDLVKVGPVASLGVIAVAFTVGILLSIRADRRDPDADAKREERERARSSRARRLGRRHGRRAGRRASPAARRSRAGRRRRPRRRRPAGAGRSAPRTSATSSESALEGGQRAERHAAEHQRRGARAPTPRRGAQRRGARRAAKIAAQVAIVSGFEAVAATGGQRSPPGRGHLLLGLAARAAPGSGPQRARADRAQHHRAAAAPRPSAARRSRAGWPRRRGRGPRRAGRSAPRPRRWRGRSVNAPRSTERMHSSDTGPGWAPTKKPRPKPTASARHT